MAANLWRSERLVYRAVETDDEAFFTTLNQDPALFAGSSTFLPVPQGKQAGKGYVEWLQSCLLSAVICLPAPAATADSASGPDNAVVSKPIPIGAINLQSSPPKMDHHRRSMIGVTLTQPYQGKGYGSEAIKWVLRWGFNYANLHKIEIGAFAHNTGAIQLYERLGFVLEARKRDWLFLNGKYWDLVELGMLEDEWREKFDQGDAEDAAPGSQYSAL